MTPATPNPRRTSRRTLLGASAGALGLAAMRALPAAAEFPTGGCGRPGPGCVAPVVRTTRGPMPISITIPQADVDAPVELTEIIGGVMQNPSGPFVVAWYRESGRPGENDNMVMSGHLDYWNVGEAVFFNVGALKQGDAIDVLGDDGLTYRYAVEWVRDFETDGLGQEGIQLIVGKTAEERLTLITCGGEFDYNTGQYKERTVVRAVRLPDASA
jgi:LPXTG-site transpeptidase (sortase) family protein